MDYLEFGAAIEKLGNEGWNWARFLEYSKKSERYVTFRTLYFSYIRSSFTLPSPDLAFLNNQHFDEASLGRNGMHSALSETPSSTYAGSVNVCLNKVVLPVELVTQKVGTSVILDAY